MLKQVRGALVRRGIRTALQATADAAATATAKSFRQLFNVDFPVTVYVRASNCHLTVRKRIGNQVELDASFQAAFGWEFVTEQDDAGVYIVARRKPVVGALSAARLTLIVPPEANLALHLTPGSLHIMDMDGQIDLAGTSPDTRTIVVTPPDALIKRG